MLALIVVADAVVTAPRRAADMPEPLVSETITDVDGVEAGELEFDVTGYAAHHVQAVELEAEWRALARLGVELDAGLGNEASGWDGDLRLGISVPLIHRGIHVMFEAGARVLDRGAALDPGEAALPYTAGLRAGERFGMVTLRAGLDVELGGAGARVPLAGNAAVLLEYGPQHRGFVGVEGLVDGAATLPLMFIPEIAYRFGTRLPVRLGVAMAVAFDPSSGASSVGALLRATLELGDDD